MFKMACNIDKSDRINRIVFGGIMVVGAILGFGQRFLFLLGVIMVIEGAIGWCGIPILVEKAKAAFRKNPPSQPRSKQ